MTFDPNAAASEDSGIFGLPFSEESAKLILIPVPWEATTSYGGGTAFGPEAIFHASKQVDLFDRELGNFYEAGIAMCPASQNIKEWNHAAKAAAQAIIQGTSLSSEQTEQSLSLVNSLSEKVNSTVYTETKRLLSQGKLVGIVGGDHSVPFGAIQAFLEKYPNMGILHFDAHADLRDAYEGFHYSHASIMHNVMTKTSLAKLVQVGLRDFCEQEFDFIQSNKNKITSFFDADLCEQKMHGNPWAAICDVIVQCLPQEVYISFDIDGLDPRFCPHTGTPVPGGLDFNEALFLIKTVARSGRKIIGFDLNEVSPGAGYLETEEAASEWDANVGARLLYKLCGFVLKTQRL